jgi:hypothetical protein
LDENAVIAAVCDYLSLKNYDVTQRRHTTEQGVDIVAKNRESGSSLYIEAKGGTSSREGSARYGKGFNSTQVYDRVAKAVYATLCLRAEYPDRVNQEVGLAFPDTPQFRKRLEPIRNQLSDAGLVVFLVDVDKRVSRL